MSLTETAYNGRPSANEVSHARSTDVHTARVLAVTHDYC